MNFFNLGAQKLTLYRYTKLYGFISQKTVHQTNQSLQSIKYHRTKWPWFPFKIKMNPLRLMGRWCLYCPRVQFVFHIHTYILMNFMCALQNWKSNIFQNHILSLNNRLPFNLYAGKIVEANLLNYDMMLSTYILMLIS